MQGWRTILSSPTELVFRNSVRVGTEQPWGALLVSQSRKWAVTLWGAEERELKKSVNIFIGVQSTCVFILLNICLPPYHHLDRWGMLLC